MALIAAAPERRLGALTCCYAGPVTAASSGQGRAVAPAGRVTGFLLRSLVIRSCHNKLVNGRDPPGRCSDGSGVKKLPVTLALLAAVGLFGLTACDDDSDEPTDLPTTTYVSPSASASPVVVPSASESVKVVPSASKSVSASPSVSVSVSVKPTDTNKNDVPGDGGR